MDNRHFRRHRHLVLAFLAISLVYLTPSAAHAESAGVQPLNQYGGVAKYGA